MSAPRGQAYLTTAAQVSLGIAGITGFLVVLRQDATWSPSELMGLRLIFESAGAGVLLSLLAVLLGSSCVSERKAWTAASVVLALVLAAELVLQCERWIHIGGLGASPRHPLLLILLFFVPVSALLIIQLINVFRWKAFGPFATGIFWLVLAAGFQTALFLLHATKIRVP